MPLGHGETHSPSISRECPGQEVQSPLGSQVSQLASQGLQTPPDSENEGSQTDTHSPSGVSTMGGGHVVQPIGPPLLQSWQAPSHDGQVPVMGSG